MSMKDFLSRRKVMWIVIGLIALLPLPSVINYMQRFVVRNGIVTAFRYEVHAPIDGVVHTLSAIPGTAPGDAAVMRLGNKRKTGQYANLALELASLTNKLEESEARFVEYTKRLVGDMDKSLAIRRARLVAEKASMRESQQKRERTMKLIDEDVATKEDLDKAEAQFREDEADVRTTILEIEQFKHRRKMLNQGLLPTDVADGALQLQNRINILHQDILACKRQMSESQTEASEETGNAERLNTGSASASVVLPETAVIWEIDVQDGMEVVKGERLLSYIDRSRLMVEVAVDDATLELISPGHPVRVRLFGRRDFIEGTVTRVMGSAGIWHSSLFAAAIKQRSNRDGRVLVQIDDERLHGEVEKFCGVGRTAYAEFEGIGLWEQYFGVFLR
ncbi:HlyD family efflux transporter periplasmic adaptor subunit [Pseudodesulfovibrio sp.]|nr:HlyD family efflux transporter periplasmic adaptor subunit [Pseudodesulfovibrio sp.]